MGLIKRIKESLARGHRPIAYELHQMAEANDKMASMGFDSLIKMLEQSQETLEIVKRQESLGIHICYNFPCDHPFWDTWD